MPQTRVHRPKPTERSTIAGHRGRAMQHCRWNGMGSAEQTLCRTSAQLASIARKKFLLSSVALMGFTAGAMAADLPRRSAPPAYFAPMPVFTWTGFYVGVNAGYAWNNSDNGDCF